MSKGFKFHPPFADDHWTTTFPVILGWIEQKYGYSPALVNVNENFSSVSSTLDLNTLSVLTTVCGMSSRLTQVTVAPTATVIAAGPKTKLSIFTSAVEAVFSWALAVKLLCSPTIPPKPITAVTSKLATNTLLLMIFLPFL